MTGSGRIVYFGTPEFAVPTLAALAESGDPVILVVTQPDRPQGRGLKMVAPPVKRLAERLGLPVVQPENIRSPDFLERIKEAAPDAMVVVAFGRLLPPSLLSLCPPGPVNLHPSLLPNYRGPSPIQSALLAGDPVTGVTTMILDEGQDTGPILLRREVAVLEGETAGQLHDRLAVVGAELMVETLAGLKAGTVVPRPQPGECPQECRLLAKEDGRVDWTRPAAHLALQVRAFDPWPGAYTFFKGQRLKLFGGRVGTGRGRPGQVLALDEGDLHVAAGEGSLRVAEFQLEGRKRQTALQFWHGQHLGQNMVFGS